MRGSKTILSTQKLVVGYGTKEVLSDLNLDLNNGEFTCLLGPNGAGKSTLMRSIAGVQAILSGSVELNGDSLKKITNKEKAKLLSMVLTDKTSPGNLTAYALVSLGRFPYTSWLGALSKEDKSIIEWAMDMTGTKDFANQHIAQLSDGERQKVMIARALAQDTPLMFLDEPTAHLDLPNRIEIFHLLKELTKATGKTILLSSHDMEMALSHADKLWLVNDRRISTGVPEDLVLQGHFEAAFKREGLRYDYAQGTFKKIQALQPKKVRITGAEVLQFWTEKALRRSGFAISESEGIKVEVTGDRKNPHWEIEGSDKRIKTIEELLIELN